MATTVGQKKKGRGCLSRPVFLVVLVLLLGTIAAYVTNFDGVQSMVGKLSHLVGGNGQQTNSVGISCLVKTTLQPGEYLTIKRLPFLHGVSSQPPEIHSDTSVVLKDTTDKPITVNFGPKAPTNCHRWPDSVSDADVAASPDLGKATRIVEFSSGDTGLQDELQNAHTLAHIVHVDIGEWPHAK